MAKNLTWEPEADFCRRHGWKVGQRLAGDEGAGPTVIEISAIGQTNVLAVKISHDGKPAKHLRESLWSFGCRDWQPVTPHHP